MHFIVVKNIPNVYLTYRYVRSIRGSAKNTKRKLREFFRNDSIVSLRYEQLQ